MYVPGLAVNVGAWCNGNTWVSKTFVVSSNLTAPAKFERFAQAERSFLCSSANNSPKPFMLSDAGKSLTRLCSRIFPLLV